MRPIVAFALLALGQGARTPSDALTPNTFIQFEYEDCGSTKNGKVCTDRHGCEWLGGECVWAAHHSISCFGAMQPKTCEERVGCFWEDESCHPVEVTRKDSLPCDEAIQQRSCSERKGCKWDEAKEACDKVTHVPATYRPPKAAVGLLAAAASTKKVVEGSCPEAVHERTCNERAGCLWAVSKNCEEETPEGLALVQAKLKQDAESSSAIVPAVEPVAEETAAPAIVAEETAATVAEPEVAAPATVAEAEAAPAIVTEPEAAPAIVTEPEAAPAVEPEAVELSSAAKAAEVTNEALPEAIDDTGHFEIPKASKATSLLQEPGTVPKGEAAAKATVDPKDLNGCFDRDVIDTLLQGPQGGPRRYLDVAKKLGKSVAMVQGESKCKEGQFFIPRMETAERQLMAEVMDKARAMANKKKTEVSYLEWGSGGSTMTYAFLADKAYSIEHVTDWCGYLNTQPLMVQAKKDGRMRAECVKTNLELGHWGHPRGTPHQISMGGKLYVNKIEAMGAKRFDVILVDGRWRVSCALKALNYMDADSVLLVHDNAAKPQWRNYKELLSPYFDFVKEGDSLIQLKPKKSMLGNTELWEKHLTEEG